jgi:phospholipase A-2-activating protein
MRRTATMAKVKSSGNHFQILLAAPRKKPFHTSQPTKPTMEIEWDLSRSFTSDGVGIRCAVLLGESTILTGTQGGSLVQYDRESGALQVIPYQHDHAVTALLANDTIYVTGCKDSIIRLFDIHQHGLLAELKGHDEGKPVTSLAWGDHDDAKTLLLSGSWDGTARIWNVITKAMLAVLPNHENSVCVTSIRYVNDVLTVATGSAGLASQNVIAGHTVRLWNIHTMTGDVQLLHSVANDHDGPIRDIHYDNAAGTLLTCSNDGTVKIRDADTGICQSTMMFFTQQQHPPMLLSLAAVADGENSFVATAEDGNVVVWTRDARGTPATAPLPPPPQIIRHGTWIARRGHCYLLRRWRVTDLYQIHRPDGARRRPTSVCE